MIEMRRKLETPSTPQHKVYAYHDIVYLVQVEITVTAQSPWMFRIVALACARKESQVPILGHVPVEGIERIQENEEEPAIVSPGL